MMNSSLKKVKRTQTVRATLTGAQGAGTYPFTAELDKKYDECIGVEGHEVDGSEQNYNIGVRYGSDEIITPAPKNHLLTNASVGQNDKAKDVNFNIRSGQEVSADIELKAASTDSIDVYLTFTLVKYLQER